MINKINKMPNEVKKTIKNNSSKKLRMVSLSNHLGNFLITLLIFLILTGWIFVGWPQIWQDPPIPPKIQIAHAIQTGTPSGDISTGSWTEGVPGADADVFLYNEIDEGSADGDTTYIVEITTETTFEVSLTSLTDPGADTGHIIHIWMRSIGSGGPEKLRVALVQGTIVIATSENFTNRSSTYVEQTFAIAEAVAANITDYTNLRIRFLNQGLGNNEEMRVTKAELQIPDAVGVPPATWREVEDTPTSGVNKNENIRLRIEVTNSVSEATDYDYLLEYAAKVGGFCDSDESFIAIPVTASTEHFEMIDSTYFVNGEPTTNQLTVPDSFTFVAGRMVEDPSNSSGNITLPFENYTEIEFIFWATSNATNGGDYCFRLTNTGTTLDEYSVYPELQIIP